MAPLMKQTKQPYIPSYLNAHNLQQKKNKSKNKEQLETNQTDHTYTQQNPRPDDELHKKEK
jgi:hypothetical protein